MISATEVPDSACRERERNLLFSKMLLFHQKPNLSGDVTRVKTLTSRMDQEMGGTSTPPDSFYGSGAVEGGQVSRTRRNSAPTLEKRHSGREG